MQWTSIHSKNLTFITDFHNYGATRHPWTMTEQFQNLSFFSNLSVQASCSPQMTYFYTCCTVIRTCAILIRSCQPFTPQTTLSRTQVSLYLHVSFRPRNVDCGIFCIGDKYRQIKQKQKINNHNELLQTQMLVDVGSTVLLWRCRKVVHKSNRNVIKGLRTSTWEDFLKT
jgi:hypothetical protein